MAESPEVNGLNPPMLPGSFLPCAEEEMSLGTRLVPGSNNRLTDVGTNDI